MVFVGTLEEILLLSLSSATYLLGALHNLPPPCFPSHKTRVMMTVKVLRTQHKLSYQKKIIIDLYYEAFLELSASSHLADRSIFHLMFSLFLVYSQRWLLLSHNVLFLDESVCCLKLGFFLFNIVFWNLAQCLSQRGCSIYFT